MTGGVEPLDGAFASPHARQRYARRLFATIADRYDLITVVLSFGLDRHWKKRVIELVEPVGGTRALDLASGTGDLAFALTVRGASVTGLDVTHRMLELAREKAAHRPGIRSPGFVTADMCALPFPNAHFDIVTTGYGLRNVPDLSLAVEEIYRVLRPGGALVSLDFNRPENAFVRGIYLGYLWIVGGALGWVLHRDPDTYRYIPASIRRYPGAARVAGLMQSTGFSKTRWIPVLGGLMAIHLARK